MTRITQKKRGGSKGGVIAAIALLLAGVAAGVTYYVKPELFGVEPDPVAAGDEAGAQAAEKIDKAVSKKKKRGSAFDGMKLVSDSSWKDVAAKRDELAGKITATMGGSTTAQAESFINKEENRMLPEKYRKPETPLPVHEPFPGKLASQGGLVWTSSTSGYDKPCYHWGLLEPCGGMFHTGKDENDYSRT